MAAPPLYIYAHIHTHTHVQMSAVRALEAERPDRLFDDPLSFHFAGEEAMRQAHTRAQASRASQGVGRKIAVRTRFFDDFLLDCCCGCVGVGVCNKRRKRDVFFASVWRPWRKFSFMYRGKRGERGKKKRELIKQVLILGCGMDTRAWRLPLGENVTVVEVCGCVFCLLCICDLYG